MALRLAMLAMLSLPAGILGLSLGHFDPLGTHLSPLAMLAAMLVLGVFVFLRQFFRTRH